MFRRRPLRRRAIRRLQRVPPPPGRPQQALNRANQLMEDGNYEAAADIFEDLAERAYNRGKLRRAPYLFLQAARARLWASQLERAEELLYHGLNMLVDNGQWPALHRLGTTAVNEYKRLDQQEAADKLQAWLDEALKDHPEATQQAFGQADMAQQKQPKLPDRCPQCGATVRPNEVEWLDQHTAECLYCGSSIQAKE
jgi:tetratricopeptide (TPR) repeat protein